MRTLYRFIDEGQLPAYKMGRVIRLQARDVDAFIAGARIAPGTLEHLYPDPRGVQSGRGQPHETGTRAGKRPSGDPEEGPAVDGGAEDDDEP